ncbi:MAG: hypothetical protein HN790_06490 [Methylococcales bacterium]|jgi:methyl-accepting chemotaxis protein|nr:hypothetical protein [Methylococcales bacterium]
MVEVSDAAQELTGIAKKGSTEVEKQIEGASTIAGSVNKISDNIAQAAESAEQLNVMSQASFDCAKRGKKMVQAMFTELNNINQVVSDTTDTTQVLNTRSDEINQIVDVIQSIAEQTNLLALNAAIEAARAGEQGRGFAVVADEVRSLASRTRNSTIEIGDLVQSIHGEVNKIVDGAGAIQSGFVDVIEMSEQAEQALVTINDQSQQGWDKISSITSALSEQSKASADISHHLNLFETIERENGALLNDIRLTADYLLVLAKDEKNRKGA